MNASPSWARAGLLLLALLPACGPTSKRLRSELDEGARGGYLPGVPFVRQRRDHCGPAALASVARYAGVDTSQAAIAEDTFLPSIGATLTLDLERCARALGLWVHAEPGTAQDVRVWLDRGVPVVALLKLGWLQGGALHYIVVTGYHADLGYFIAHTGHLSNRPIAFGTFEKQSAGAGRWLLVACDPEKVTWPLTADGHKRLGLLFERRGDLARARAEFQLAVAAAPTQAIHHYNLGNALARSGDRSGAVRRYREALKLEPDFADAHNNLASVLLLLGRREEALAAARRAVAIGGERVAYYHDTLGRVLLAQSQFDEAAAAFRQAIAAARDDATRAEARQGLEEAESRGSSRQQQ
ncbi:tetratricopeptide repeat protein [bacterium]|nr:tetratricopeptide repeat protein [bacterium]